MKKMYNQIAGGHGDRTMTAKDRCLVHRREKWLGKKKMTMSDFAESIRISYNTVFRWITEPRKLHRLYAERVISIYADFPIK